MNLPSIIPTSDDNKSQSNIQKTQISNTDNQISLLDDKLRKKDKEIVELRSNLNNLNELKTKLEDRNKEISRLKNELEQTTNSNNAQTNEIIRLKNELEQTTNSNNAQTNEIIRLKNKLDRAINSKQSQTNEITRLKNELDQAINSKQAQINEIKKSNTKLSKKVTTQNPSFNCKNVFKWDEKIICSNPTLANLDLKLSRNYKAALKSTHDNKAKRTLINRQKNWLNIRHQCKKDNEKIICLKKEYARQIVFLQGQHKSNQNLQVVVKAPPGKKRKPQISFRLNSLFQKLPVYNYSRYNRTTVLDKNSNLLWTKLNFAQKEGVFPENAIECQEWAAQMVREKYGGVKNWRVPKHFELSTLFELYNHVIGGKNENFVYWGLNDTAKNIEMFSFKYSQNNKINMNNHKSNCRLVANLKKIN